MKKYILEFIHRGLLSCGFGPISWSIVYFFLNKNGVVEVLTVRKVIFEIVTVTILAFVAGGLNIIYQIEKIPLMAAISVHGVVLYLDYVIIYLLNDWLASDVLPLIVFTVFFFAGYAVVWTIIYFVISRNTNRMNQKLSQLQKQDPIISDEK